MESAREMMTKFFAVANSTHTTAGERIDMVIALIEADRAATEAKVREEYAGLVERAIALAKGLQNDLWGDINDYNNAVSDVLIELAALGKVSQ